MAAPRIKIGLTLIVISFGLIISGHNLWLVAGVLLALGLHEISHILTSNLLGYQVFELKMTVFGGCLTIDPLFHANPNAELVIAAAGPALNLLMALGVVYLDYLGIHHDYLEYWRKLNLGLGLVNLIPAYPLDGGRIIHAWLAKINGLKSAALVSRWISLGMAVFLLISGLLRLFLKTGGFTFLMVGLFVLVQCWFCKTPEINVWKILRQKQKNLNQKGFINARLVRVEPGTPLRLPLQHSGTQEYLLFFMEDACKNIRLMSEEHAWHILGKEGYQATFKPEQDRIND